MSLLSHFTILYQFIPCIFLNPFSSSIYYFFILRLIEKGFKTSKTKREKIKKTVSNNTCSYKKNVEKNFSYTSSDTLLIQYKN